jgi:hypothetical protein
VCNRNIWLRPLRGIQVDAEEPFLILRLSEAPEDAGVDDLLGKARIELPLDSQTLYVVLTAPRLG